MHASQATVCNCAPAIIFHPSLLEFPWHKYPQGLLKIVFFLLALIKFVSCKIDFSTFQASASCKHLPFSQHRNSLSLGSLLSSHLTHGGVLHTCHRKEQTPSNSLVSHHSHAFKCIRPCASVLYLRAQISTGVYCISATSPGSLILNRKIL